MRQLRACLFLGVAILLAWFLMQAVHELGHIVGAWMTGGRVDRVVLHPLQISRTDVRPNPSPLTVVWAGPMLGIVIPLAVWGLARTMKRPWEYMVRFFAGFCLIANGAYIGIGSFSAIGDCGEMLRHGSPRWLLWLFGVVTLPLGLALWNRLGRHFGIGKDAEEIHDRQWMLAALILCLVMTLEITLKG